MSLQLTRWIVIALCICSIPAAVDLRAQTDQRISPPDPPSYLLPQDAQIQSAATRDGRTLVVWGNRRIDSNGQSINSLTGRLVSASGSETVMVHSDAARPWGFVSVVAIGRGYLVVWNDRRSRSPGIYLGLLDRLGNRIEDEVRIGGGEIEAGAIWLLEEMKNAPILVWNSRTGNTIMASVARLDSSGRYRDGFTLWGKGSITGLLSFVSLPGATVLLTSGGRTLYMHPDGQVDTREVSRTIAATGHIRSDSSSVDVAGRTIRLYPNIFDTAAYRTLNIPTLDSALAGSISATRSRPDELTIGYMSNGRLLHEAGTRIEAHRLRIDSSGAVLSDSITHRDTFVYTPPAPYCQVLSGDYVGARQERRCDDGFDVSVEFRLVYAGSCDPRSFGAGYHITPDGTVGDRADGPVCSAGSAGPEARRTGSDTSSSVTVVLGADTIRLSEPIPAIIAPFDELSPALFTENDTLCAAWVSARSGGSYQIARRADIDRQWAPVAELKPAPLRPGTGAYNFLRPGFSYQDHFSFALNRAFAVANVCLLGDYYRGTGGHSTFDYMVQTSQVSLFVPSPSGWKTYQQLVYSDDYMRPDQRVESVTSSADGDVLVSVAGAGSNGSVPPRVIVRLRPGAPNAVWKNLPFEAGELSLVALGGDTVVAITRAKAYLLERVAKIGELAVAYPDDGMRYYPLHGRRFIRLQKSSSAERFLVTMFDASGGEIASREVDMRPSDFNDIALTQNQADGQIAILWSEGRRIHCTLMSPARLGIIRGSFLVSDSSASATRPNALFRHDTLQVVWQDRRNRSADIYMQAVAVERLTGIDTSVLLPPHVDPILPTPGVRTYPNPASGHVAVAFELPFRSTVTLRLYDSRGVLVRAGSPELYHTGAYWKDLDISGLPSGHYTIVVETDFGREAHRLIIGRVE